MRTIVTPGGDSVEVVPDSEWPAKIGSRTGGMWVETRGPILLALWKHGPYVDEHGRATAPFREDATALGWVGKHVGTAFTSALGGTALGLAIDRKLNGKRTLAIRMAMLPESWVDWLDAECPRSALSEPEPEVEVVDTFEDEPVIEPEPEEVIEADGLVEAVPADDTDLPAIEVRIARSVATELLTMCVEIISTGQGFSHQDKQRMLQMQRDLAEVEGRLAQRLEENRSLRRKLDVAEDTARARGFENEGLRKQIRVLEHNLKMATNGQTQKMLDEMVARKLNEVLRIDKAPGPNRELASDSA